MRKGMIALCALLAASALVFASGANEQSKPSTIDWQFTTADARTKLKRLYPVVV